jgi:hypothetical protein
MSAWVVAPLMWLCAPQLYSVIPIAMERRVQVVELSRGRVSDAVHVRVMGWRSAAASTRIVRAHV